MTFSGACALVRKSALNSVQLHQRRSAHVAESIGQTETPTGGDGGDAESGDVQRDQAEHTVGQAGTEQRSRRWCVTVTTISTRIHAVNSGPMISDERGEGAIRSLSKNPLIDVAHGAEAHADTGEAGPHAAGQREVPVDGPSVGNPGISVMAKKVPLNATVWKTGMATAGKNADGSRRMLRKPRSAKPRDDRRAAPPGLAWPAGGEVERRCSQRVIVLPIVSRGFARPRTMETTPMLIGTRSAAGNVLRGESVDDQPTNPSTRCETGLRLAITL